MQTRFTLLAVLLLAIVIGNAQQAVTNGGFEAWTSTSTPTGWTTYENLIPPIAGVGLTSKDSVDKVQGTASIKITSQYVSLASDTVAGAVAIGSGTFSGGSPKLFGTPFTSSPDTVQFAFKYEPVGNDTCGFDIELHKAGGSTYKLQLTIQLLATPGQWLVATLPLKQYYSDTTGTTDTLKLAFFSSALSSQQSPRVGSTMHVDAVRFGYKTTPTFIEDINDALTVKVFPNPANQLVNIQTSEPVKDASIIVYDMTGRVITHEFQSGQNFELVTANWESGIYSYSVLSGGVVVNKGRIMVQH